MSIYRALLTSLFIGVASTALGQANVPAPEEMGTPEQRAACGHDVGRFCKSVKPEDGPFGYLFCLCVPKIRFYNIGGEGHRELGMT